MKTRSLSIIILIILCCLSWSLGAHPIAAEEVSKFIKMQKEVYASGEAIEVEFSGLPGNQQDWITVVKKGTPESSYGEYFYTQGKKQGSYEFKGLSPGEYEVRVYFNWPDGGYTVQDRFSFEVAESSEKALKDEQPAPDKRAGYDPTVERVQLELTELGYEPGPVDGKMGNKTAEAIKKYQAENKLEATGELDEATLKKLRIAPPKINCTSYSCTVENGLIDETVEQIKKHLSEGKNADELILKNGTDSDLKKLPAFNEVLFELRLTSSDYITDITPVEKLTKLENLELSYLKNLTDVAVLEKLEKLKKLTLRELGTPVGLTPLAMLANLEELFLFSLNKEVAEPFDSSVLAGKTHLKTLKIDGVNIKDLSSVKDSPGLITLRLAQAPIEDISPLNAFPNLKYLEFSKVPVKDLRPLEGLPELRNLTLYYTEVTDLSPLTSLKNSLKYLNLNGTKAKEMSPVGELTELTDIILDETEFDDYSPLANCTKLGFLQARSEKSGFDKLEVINTMPNLKTLWLDRNTKVQHWDTLKTAQSLENLSLGKTTFSDLNLLADLTKLRDLNMYECTVTNPEAITTLPELKRLSIRATKGIDDLTIFTKLPKLADLSINYQKDQFPQEQIDALNKAIEEAKKKK